MITIEDIEEFKDETEVEDILEGYHEKLVSRLKKIHPYSSDLYFSSVSGCEEDYATVEYLGYCAVEAGITAQYIKVEDISVNSADNFCTKDGDEINHIFALYPWEDMMLDDYAKYQPKSNTKWIEPAWKSIVSNKGLLAVLWEMFPNHPNLLPTYFEDQAPSIDTAYVKKPIFSREGSSIEMVDSNGQIIEKSDDESYKHNATVIQEYKEIPNFDGNFPVIGSWIVGDECVGMGIREDHSRITQDLSRYTPHVIE